MAEPIISVSGLRGIVGKSLDPLIASRYAAAFASETKTGTIVVGRDGRPTGQMLASAISSTLQAAGRDVLFADAAATPTIGVLVREHKAAGGIQISASHNPAEYNGMKLFGADGRVINATAGQRVLEKYQESVAPWVAHNQIGRLVSCDDTTSAHLQSVLSTVDVDRIRGCKFRVVLDSNHGAGAVLGKHLLDKLGCEFTILGAEPTGQFIHLPEPTAENLSQVGANIVSSQAVIGFCQDPDADRLALIDEEGRFIGEEYTVAIVLKHILKNRRGPIVTNCSTSRMAEDVAAEFDVPFFRSKVGEANVCDVMKEHDAVYGGEGNGGPIDPQVGYVRDSFVGIAQVLDAMAESQKKISQLAAELPRYEIYKTKMTMTREAIAGVFDQLEGHFSSAKADRMDGLRLDWEDKWLLVRASNTEPIVRFIAEASSMNDAKELCEQAKSVI